MIHEPAIGLLYALCQRNAGRPAKAAQTTDIEEFAWRSIGFARIEVDASGKADDPGNHFRELAYRQILAAADVDEIFAVLALHEKEAGIGRVVHVQELTPRRSGSP